ncbi:MAG: nucleotide exchange factor GrpE [Porticoccaceae bacterium]
MNSLLAEADLAVLQAELDTAREQVLRTQAEMQNLHRRVERDIENAHKYGMEKLVSELLPVVDNLERSIAAIDGDSGDHSAIAEGVADAEEFSGCAGAFQSGSD